ncbi:hypothetical protein [Nonomuraea dietziae]|uniref:hypothetical protein n=1 Tax=Nonomuraea dietziae TaxID=65515 RepID=UPI00343D598C
MTTTLIKSAVAAATMAALLSVPTVASAEQAKKISFRGMQVSAPAKWTTEYVEWNDIGKDWRQVYTTGCVDKPTCPGFDIVGPKVIKGGQDMESYKTRRPFAPGTGVSGCRFGPENGYGERFPDDKPAVSGYRQVGRHKAQYREWAGECYSFKTDKRSATFTQREWYLPKEGILIVDGWNTPGLAKILERATWK